MDLLGWRFHAPGDGVLTVAEFPGYWMLRMALDSDLAYLRSSPREGDPPDQRFFTAGHIHAIGCVHEGYRCLAFRGTDPHSPRDWATDLNFWLSGPLGVHRGFWTAWTQIRPSVLAWLHESRPPDRVPFELVLGGHSLGGALAQVAAFDLSERFAIAGVFTFAAPRVGALAFRNEYCRRAAAGGLNLDVVTRRVNCGQDTVPSVPPPPLFGHIGRAFDLPVNDEFKIPGKPNFFDTFVSAAAAGIPDLLPNVRFKDQAPGFAAILAVLLFWLCYYFLPNAAHVAGLISGLFGEKVRWGLGALILTALAHQLTYLLPMPVRGALRWAAALAIGCAMLLAFPRFALAAGWTAVLIAAVLILALRLVLPGAALDHSMSSRYLRALTCSRITCEPQAPPVYKQLGLNEASPK